MYKFSSNSLKNLEGVNPELLQVVHHALGISKVDFGIPQNGGLRSDTEQRKLFLSGKSRLDGVEKKSKHQTGDAFDVFAYVDGKASWDVNHMSQVALAVLQSAVSLGVKVQWGGFWKNFVDLPHFELID